MKRKKSMTVFDIIAWTNENRELIIGSRINNIYYAGGYWALKILTKDGKKFLKIEPGKRIHLSLYEPYRKSIDKFTAFLRKHVRGGIIKNLKYPSFERIVFIDIDKSGKKYRLIAEILPRGFVILTLNDTILYANKFAELRDRVVKPRHIYQMPPSGINPLITEIGGLEKLMHRGKDLVRGIIYGWNLPGEIAEEILYRAGLYEVKTIKPQAINRDDLEVLKDELIKLYKESLHGKGYLIKYGDLYVSFTPYYPRIYSELHEMNIIETPKFNNAVDTFFSTLEKEEIKKYEEKSIEAEIARIKKSIEEQEKIVNRYRELSRRYNEVATLIATNYEYVSEILECVNKVRKEISWEQVKKHCNKVYDYDASRGTVTILLDGKEIVLDVRSGVDGNIMNFYRLAGEYRAKADRALKSIKELREKLKQISEKAIVISRRVEAGIKPRLWYERFHWLITSEGLLVIAGRDANQNEAIVRRYLDKKDVFLHADIHGAPATVIKTRGKIPGEKSIHEASVIAACYSRAWKLGFGEIDVYWVRGEQVSKKPPSGEYLGKGAFMIYGKKNYIRHVKLELAIGIEEVYDEIYGRYQRVIVGPNELIKDRAIAYTLIVPGRLTPSKAAKRILDLINKITNTGLMIKVEEIVERLPGPLDIIGVEKGVKQG